MGDPMTDIEAAKAFTEQHAKQAHNYRSGPYMPVAGCRAKVRDTTAFHRYHQCCKPPKVTLADGSEWCGVHKPEAVAKRAAKREGNWKADAVRVKRETRFVVAGPDLLSIARMAADGTYIPRDHARAVLERHGLVPGKDER